MRKLFQLGGQPVNKDAAMICRGLPLPKRKRKKRLAGRCHVCKKHFDGLEKHLQVKHPEAFRKRIERRKALRRSKALRQQRKNRQSQPKQSRTLCTPPAVDYAKIPYTTGLKQTSLGI